MEFWVANRGKKRRFYLNMNYPGNTTCYKITITRYYEKNEGAIRFFNLKIIRLKFYMSSIVIQSFVAIFIRVIGALASITLTFIVAKSLNLEQAGLYFLAFSVVNILSAVARAGMDNTLVRYGGATPELINNIFFKALFLSGTLSIFLWILIQIFTDELASNIFSKPQLSPILGVISASILGVSWLTLVSYGLQGLGRIVASVFTLNIAINATVGSYIIIFGVNSALQLASIFAYSTILIAMMGVVFFWLTGERTTKFNVISWSKLQNSFMPLWSVVVMGQFIQWAPPLLGGMFIDSEGVAILTVAQRIAMLISFVLVSVNMVVAPKIARLKVAGELSDIQTVISLALRFAISLSVPIMLLFFLFPEVILRIFGAEFAVEGQNLLRVLVVAQFVNVITGPAGMVLTMMGQEKYVRRSVFFGFFVTLILVPLLANYFGLFGAGVGAALGIFTQNIMACYYLNSVLNINIFRCVGR